MSLVAVTVATTSLVILVVNFRNHQTASDHILRVTGIPSIVPTSLANLMGLTPVPPKLAAGFTLTDQRGHQVSLEEFRGHPIVLEFMDPHCTDICPLVSSEFVDANQDLGATLPRVEFLAINVNLHHARVSDVATFSKDHGLDSIHTGTS